MHFSFDTYWPLALLLVPLGLFGWRVASRAPRPADPFAPSPLLILMPWQWHHRFGEKVRPMLIRRMKVYAAWLLAFGVLIIYAVFTGVSATAA